VRQLLRVLLGRCYSLLYLGNDFSSTLGMLAVALADCVMGSFAAARAAKPVRPARPRTEP